MTTTTLRPNVPLLRLVLTHIEMHPRQWDQRYWRSESAICGTAYCFAGWTVVLSGGRFVANSSALVVPAGADVDDPGQWRDVAEYACELLGLPTEPLPDHEVSPLFDAENTLADLRRIVADLCQEAGVGSC